MFENNQKCQSGNMQGAIGRVVNGPVDAYDTRTMKTTEHQQTLGTKVETIYYAANRIEERIARIRGLLFGEHSLQEDSREGLGSIEDVINGINGNVERIEKALDSIMYRLSGD